MARVVIVEFGEVKFRRYPDSPHRELRLYFTPGITDRANGVESLHREVWKAAHGSIPRGHHIHHRDGDPLNNALDNLVCLDPKAHAGEHWTPERAEAAREHMEEIRPLTKTWHRSPEGREWHRQHGKRVAAVQEPRHFVCDQCGQGFDSVKSFSRFCSNKCKSAWRRDSGLDDVDFTCPVCGKTTRRNRYKKARTCSRKCAWALRRS